MKLTASCLIILLLGQGLSCSQPMPDQTRAIEIIEQTKNNFFKIKDAAGEITLDYNLNFFGCSGLRRLKGNGYYKSPDKIKAALDNVTYFARGNQIKKVDEKGKKWYVKLFNSLDFSPGFHPGLIAHNFNLLILEEKPDQIIILGAPKPGILKNVSKVLFHIDPKHYILRELDVKFFNKKLAGKMKIEYENIKGLWVPIKLEGQSAIELQAGLLVGLGIKLTGYKIQINNDLSNNVFEPGF